MANERIEIPAYTDRWMMGDRFGNLVNVTRRRGKPGGPVHEIAHVRLDRSGKTKAFLLEDCRVVG